MTNSEKWTLYYVYDPMCAWCWGYKPVWEKVKCNLENELNIVYVLGGLAPDSDVVMPKSQQEQIASYWKKIEAYLGTRFNHDFWINNDPRRSTYPACRAVLAARQQKAEVAMYEAIQHAYYLRALNPSDNSTLMQLATELKLDIQQFETDLLSSETEQALLEEISFARSIGGNSFPSLFLVSGDSIQELAINYENSDATIEQIRSFIK